MISNRRPQNRFLSKSFHVTSSTKRDQSSNKQSSSFDVVDPMAVSYDDVYGFSDDDNDHEDDETRNGCHGAATTTTRTLVRDRIQKLQQRGTTTRNGDASNHLMTSSNGVVVRPPPHNPSEENGGESKVPKLKPKSTKSSVTTSSASSSSNRETLGDELSQLLQERKGKLVAVVPPKPPPSSHDNTATAFSTFRTLPNRGTKPPTVIAPKPDGSSGSFKGIPSNSTNSVRSVHHRRPPIPPMIPPIPIRKDYNNDTKNEDSGRRRQQQEEEMNVSREDEGHNLNFPSGSASLTSKDIDRGMGSSEATMTMTTRRSVKEQATVLNERKQNGARRLVEEQSSITNVRCNNTAGKQGRHEDEQRLLNDFTWFHGDLNRSEAETRLHGFKTNGAFMVRYKSTPSSESPYSLSVLQNGKVYHLQIRRKSSGTYALGDCKPDELEFPNLHEIVTYHRRHPLQLIRRKSGQLASLALLTNTPPRVN